MIKNLLRSDIFPFLHSCKLSLKSALLQGYLDLLACSQTKLSWMHFIFWINDCFWLLDPDFGTPSLLPLDLLIARFLIARSAHRSICSLLDLLSCLSRFMLKVKLICV